MQGSAGRMPVAGEGGKGRAEGKGGGGPLAKSRRQTNRGSHGRPMCSCAFPIGDSKRVRFFRTHTGTRTHSGRMTARGAAAPTTCAPTGACRQPPVAHTHDTPNRRAATCKAAQTAPARPQRVLAAGVRKETASDVCSGHRLTRAGLAWTRAAQDPPESNQQRLPLRHLRTSGFASAASACACGHGGEASTCGGVRPKSIGTCGPSSCAWDAPSL